MSKRNVEVVRGIADAWSRGDVDAFLGTLADEVEWRFADNFIFGGGEAAIGREAVRKASLGRLQSEWDGFDGRIDELIDAGDTVIGLGHYVGVFKATGRRLNAQFCHVWDLADGEVTRWRQFVDTKQFADVTAAPA